MRRLFTALLCLLILALLPADSVAAKKGGSPPDKAYMQKIWDGWSTLDTANVAQYYASGPHTFFDIAPLKYNSWDEYQAGVKSVVAGTRARNSSKR